MKGPKSLLYFLILCAFSPALDGCGTSPPQDASRTPPEFQGKSQAWFEENFGKPDAKSKRFFGGETWVYFRIAGDKPSWLFFSAVPAQCRIHLEFNKEGTLEDSAYSGC